MVGGGGGGGNILTIFSELTQKSNKMCVQETLDTKKKEAREELQHWEDYLKKVSLLLVVSCPVNNGGHWVGRSPEKGQFDVQFPVHHGGCIRWGDYFKKVSVLLVIVWEGHLNRSLCHWLFMPSQPQRLVGGKATSHKGQFATGCLKDKSKVGGDF